MSYSLTWLPEVLLSAGLKVAQTQGWESRGRGPMGQVRGVMLHHTAGPKLGNMPSLGILCNGRGASPNAQALQGPLAQLGLGRDGTYYVIAAGLANHAGVGQWRGISTGNSSFIGIEAENSGLPDDPWPEIQLDAYYRGVAAILQKIGADEQMCCGHKEYALPAGRKVDPNFDTAAFRLQVANFLKGKTPSNQIPAQDDASRPTLRRGSTGDLVSQVQSLLGLKATGNFDAGTESALRQFQRTEGLVPDGILGPKSWTQLTKKLGDAKVAQNPNAAPATPQDMVPPPDDANHPVHSDGRYAIGPGGQKFACVWKLGFQTTGETPLDSWLKNLQPSDGVSLPDSIVRVVRAVSLNEGRLEAINSYDDAFLSVGMLQWTIGTGMEAGELPPLLKILKDLDPAAFDDLFGRYHLDAETTDQAHATGLFVLDGKPMATAQAKEIFRNAEWAYRFWRACHHPSLRKAQVSSAAGRLAKIRNIKVDTNLLSAWVTSEYGVALILDQHVNRPSDVQGTLTHALEAIKNGVPPDPVKWSTQDEARLIDAYISQRDASKMTTPQKRASMIGDQVRLGLLSNERGSFSWKDGGIDGA